MLVRSCLDGDPRAFGELVARYEKVIYTLTHRMVGNREDARELTQIVFVKAWGGLRAFDPGRRFFSWIYRIAIHECLNHRRKSRRFETMEAEPPAPGPDPEQRTEDLETEAEVQRALGRISEGDRAIIVLRHFLDLSHEEIAQALRVPAKTVKSRLFTARQRLREELMRSGVERT